MTSEQRQLKAFATRLRREDRLKARAAAKWREDNPEAAAALDCMADRLSCADNDIRARAVSAAMSTHRRVQVMLVEMLIKRLIDNRFTAHEEVKASLASMGIVARGAIRITLQKFMTRSVSIDRACLNRFILVIQRMAAGLSQEEAFELVFAMTTVGALRAAGLVREPEPANVPILCGG
jgi:hypothetical protein